MSLIDVFSGTLNVDPRIRLIAEKQLLEARKDSSFIFALLDVVGSSNDSSICMSASLFLKNTIFESWNNRVVVRGPSHQRSQSSSFSDHSQGSSVSSGSATIISIEQKNLFKEKLLKTLIIVPHRPVLTHLVSILGFVITSDPFPQSWPDLVTNISQLLDTSSPKEVYCGVLCLVEVLRYYRWHDDQNIENKNQIVNALLPRLVDLGTSLIQQLPNQDHDNLETTGEIIWRILKAYKQAIGVELSSFLQQRDQLERWMNLFLSIISGGSDGADNASSNSNTSTIPLRSSLSWRKCYKWSFELVNLLFVRYSVIPHFTNTTTTSEIVLSGTTGNYQEFSEVFITSFAPGICKLYIAQVKALPETTNNETKTAQSASLIQTKTHSQRSIMIFFENCLRINLLWNIIHNNLDIILSKLIFSNLRLTDQDLYSYHYEPDQFYYEQIYQEEKQLTAKGSARSLAYSLVAYRDSVALSGILMAVNNIMKIHVNSLTNLECCLDVDSALQIMSAISSARPTRQSPIILNQMGQFVTNYVLPIFYKSNQPFLYSRSFQLIITYANIIHFSDEALQPICENIMKCLDATDDIMSKISATLALQSLLKYEFVVETQSPKIQHTMEKILLLYDAEVVSDSLSNVMEELVATFSKELIPFAFKLCHHLSNQLLHILQELQENQQDTQSNSDPDYAFLDEKAENAQHILGTLSTLLNSFQDYGNEVSRLEETIASIVKPIFDSGEIDLYPDVAELIDIIILTNKSVSQGLWTTVFNTFYEAFKNQPNHCIDAIIPCISNFVAYGGVGITKDRLEKLFQMIHYAISDPDVEFHVKQKASFLIELILVGLPDSDSYSITDLIPFIIEMPGRSLNMIVAAIFRDAAKSLTANNSLTNIFDQFLNEWTNSAIVQQELKLNIGAALKLISIRDKNISISLQQRIVLFRFIINNIIKLQPSIASSAVGTETPTSQTNNTFGFVDESHNFISSGNSFGRESDFGDIDDELPPALEIAIDSIDIKDMYIETIKGLLASNETEYVQALIQSLDEKQRIVHFSII